MPMQAFKGRCHVCGHDHDQVGLTGVAAGKAAKALIDGVASVKDAEIDRLRRHIADIGEAINPGGVKASTLELLGDELLSVLPSQ